MYTCSGRSSSWSLCCLQRVTLYHLASDDELLLGEVKCDRRKASYWTWEEKKRQKFNRRTKSPLSVFWQQIRGENCREDDVLLGLDVVVVVCSLKLSREREELSWRRRQKPNLGSRSEGKQRKKKWWETSQWEGEMLPQNCLSLLFRVSASVTGTKFTNSTSSHGRQMKLNLISKHGMSKIFVIFRVKECCFFKSKDD